MSEIKLSVVIPCYNESTRVRPTLKSVLTYLKKQKYSSEIVLVSDGSKDDTGEVLKKFKAENPNFPVQVIDRKKNHGKGYTVKEGILAAKGDFRLFMDADSATTIEEMDNFWKWFDEGYDLVIGSRHIKGGKIEKQEGLKRRILGWGGRLLIKMFAVRGIKDTQNGFKALTKESVNKIFPKLTIERWGFDIEVLAIAQHQHLKIKEIPILWHHVGESKLKAAQAAKDTLRELFKIRKNIKSGKYDK